MKISPMLLSFALLAAAAAESEPAFNLIPDSKCQPMRMNGEITGLHGWTLIDYNRVMQIRDPRRGSFLDGRDIFTLDCKDGVFSVVFKENGPDQYYRYKQNFSLTPEYAYLPVIPADNYRATGSVKLNKGTFSGFGGKVFKASENWQDFDYTFKPGVPGLSFRPVRGLKVAMKNLKVTAEYKNGIGGSIALPGGGKLTALVMPKNAPYVAKRLISCWRGWLWKMTGTALPLYERDQVRPQKGCLVFMPGKIPHEGYDFKLNKDGGTLVYGGQFAINTALYNYLRKYGYVRYDRNNGTKPPSADPKRILLAADMKCRPKYRIHTDAGSYTSPEYAQGTIRERDYFIGISDWYAQALNTCPHNSSELMPPPAQRKIHPESQMMLADGRRQTVDLFKHPQMVSPCLTDPATREYMLNRILDTVEAQDHKSVFYYALGDLPDAFCHCPRCTAENEDKTGKTYASVYFDFVKEAAERLKKTYQGKSVLYCAYHTYSLPPVGKKVPDNMSSIFCLGGMEMPCNVHLDCEMNLVGKKNLAGWKKLIGPERLGIALYDDHNPFMVLDLLDRLSKSSAERLHLYTFSMIEQYVAARWNQGDDPKKIVEDYNNGVYGSDAGKYVTAAQRLVYEYDKKYRHKPGEFSGNPGRIRYGETLDRKTFDAVYALFDKAEKAIRARKGDVVPLLWEKFIFMSTDLRKFPRSGCETDADLKAFARRVAEFIRIAGPLAKSKKYPYLTAGTRFTIWNIPARTFLTKFCGLTVPETRKFWMDEPVIVNFMKNPVKQMIGNPEKSHGHWRFQHTILRGGENGMVLRRQSSGRGRITAVLNLEQPVQCVSILTIAGWDDEKPGKTTFRILVNDREIFSGANTFPETADPAKTDPGHMVFSIPAGMLKKGENRITLLNTVKDDPKRAVRQLKNPDKPEDGYTMKQDYYWGWLAVNELRLIAPDDEFVKYAAGSSDSAWSMLRSVRPFGKITHAGGKVTIQSAGARSSGIIVPLTDSLWLLPKGVKFRMRAEVTGKGLFCAGVICYPANFRGQRTKDKMLYSMQRIRLNGNDLSLDKNVAQGALGYCCPYIYIEGDGNVEIRKFSLVPVTPEK